MVLCLATIPIVGLSDKNNNNWNRPLYCFSLLVSPTLCVFAVKGKGSNFAFLSLCVLNVCAWHTSSLPPVVRFCDVFAHVWAVNITRIGAIF